MTLAQFGNIKCFYQGPFCFLEGAFYPGHLKSFKVGIFPIATACGISGNFLFLFLVGAYVVSFSSSIPPHATNLPSLTPVSYTHLTLPTILHV